MSVEKLLSKEKKYLVAFSGGPDSVYLLLKLVSFFQEKLRDHISLIYINYHDSPFVKDASCIHDYLISRKRRLYEEWELKEKGITPEDFRVLTSLVFAYQLQYNGVPYGKAKLMAFFVDLWQTVLPSWRTLDKTEIEL